MPVQGYYRAWFSARDTADRIALIVDQLNKGYGRGRRRHAGHFGGNTTASALTAARSHSLHPCGPAIWGLARRCSSSLHCSSSSDYTVRFFSVPWSRRRQPDRPSRIEWRPGTPARRFGQIDDFVKSPMQALTSSLPSSAWVGNRRVPGLATASQALLLRQPL